eukprot:gene10441-8393_t
MDTLSQTPVPSVRARNDLVGSPSFQEKEKAYLVTLEDLRQSSHRRLRHLESRKGELTAAKVSHQARLVASLNVQLAAATSVVDAGRSQLLDFIRSAEHLTQELGSITRGTRPLPEEPELQKVKDQISRMIQASSSQQMPELLEVQLTQPLAFSQASIQAEPEDLVSLLSRKVENLEKELKKPLASSQASIQAGPEDLVSILSRKVENLEQELKKVMQCSALANLDTNSNTILNLNLNRSLNKILGPEVTSGQQVTKPNTDKPTHTTHECNDDSYAQAASGHQVIRANTTKPTDTTPECTCSCYHPTECNDDVRPSNSSDDSKDDTTLIISSQPSSIFCLVAQVMSVQQVTSGQQVTKPNTGKPTDTTPEFNDNVRPSNGSDDSEDDTTLLISSMKELRDSLNLGTTPASDSLLRDQEDADGRKGRSKDALKSSRLGAGKWEERLRDAYRRMVLDLQGRYQTERAKLEESHYLAMRKQEEDHKEFVDSLRQAHNKAVKNMATASHVTASGEVVAVSELEEEVKTLRVRVAKAEEEGVSKAEYAAFCERAKIQQDMDDLKTRYEAEIAAAREELGSRPTVEDEVATRSVKQKHAALQELQHVHSSLPAELHEAALQELQHLHSSLPAELHEAALQELQHVHSSLPAELHEAALQELQHVHGALLAELHEAALQELQHVHSSLLAELHEAALQELQHVHSSLLAELHEAALQELQHVHSSLLAELHEVRQQLSSQDHSSTSNEGTEHASDGITSGWSGPMQPDGATPARATDQSRPGKPDGTTFAGGTDKWRVQQPAGANYGGGTEKWRAQQAHDRNHGGGTVQLRDQQGHGPNHGGGSDQLRARHPAGSSGQEGACGSRPAVGGLPALQGQGDSWGRDGGAQQGRDLVLADLQGREPTEGTEDAEEVIRAWRGRQGQGGEGAGQQRRSSPESPINVHRPAAQGCLHSPADPYPNQARTADPHPNQARSADPDLNRATAAKGRPGHSPPWRSPGKSPVLEGKGGPTRSMKFSPRRLSSGGDAYGGGRRDNAGPGGDAWGGSKRENAGPGGDAWGGRKRDNASNEVRPSSPPPAPRTTPPQPSSSRLRVRRDPHGLYVDVHGTIVSTKGPLVLMEPVVHLSPSARRDKAIDRTPCGRGGTTAAAAPDATPASSSGSISFMQGGTAAAASITCRGIKHKLSPGPWNAAVPPAPNGMPVNLQGTALRRQAVINWKILQLVYLYLSGASGPWYTSSGIGTAQVSVSQVAVAVICHRSGILCGADEEGSVYL